jgi:homocysteine S-methyltransferase
MLRDNKEVEELDGSAELHTKPAEVFADGRARLRRRFGLRILVGCCRTDGGHIHAIASKLRCEVASG